MGCFDNIPLENIENCPNAELVAGISETEIYAALSTDIDTMPELPALGTANQTLEQLATVTGDITFAAQSGKGFYKMMVMPETGEVKSGLVGKKGNKKVKNSFEFFLSNTSGQNLGWLRQNKNNPLVFLVKEKSGRIRLIGSKTNPVYMETADVTTGKGQEDDTGIQVALENVEGTPSPIYTGAITLAADNHA